MPHILSPQARRLTLDRRGLAESLFRVYEGESMLNRMCHVAGGALGPALKFAVVLVCCSLAVVFAQSTTATLNGTVTDASGGSIVDAVVAITNQATGQEVQTHTSSEGTYSMPGLTSGTYKV